MTDWNLPPWVVEDQERSRLGNVFDGRVLYDATNVNDDHGSEGREDYSVALAPKVAVGAVLMTDDSAAFLASEGVEIAYA